VELNPVRARRVAHPREYPWSSYGWYAGENLAYSWLDSDPCFQAIGVTGEERHERYRGYAVSAIPAGEWDLIREALQRGQLTGSDRFIDEVHAIVGRRVEHRKQGRPGKKTK
jgi:putative transposase